MFPADDPMRIASATAGIVTPPYVTPVASDTPLFPLVQTHTVAPRAVPPGADAATRMTPSLTDPVGPRCDSELLRCATPLGGGTKTSCTAKCTIAFG